MPGVKISDLPLSTLQGPDIFPVARAGITLGVKASDILDRITKLENNTSVLSGNAIFVVDSPTIDLTYNNITRQLSADLQPTLNLRNRTVYLPLTAEIPPGTVMSFLGKTAPPGWLVCNGAIVPNGVGPVQGVITNYSRLYNVLGTTYGITPGTLPDLRGYFIRGYGEASDAIGDNADGTQSGPFGQKVTDTFQGHKHGLYDPTHDHTGSTNTTGAHTHNINNQALEGPEWIAFSRNAIPGGRATDPLPGPDSGASNGYDVDNATGNDRIFRIVSAGDHSHTVSIVANSTNVKVLSPTGDQATPGSGDSDGPGGLTPRVGFETKPKNVALLWCVKY
jgi:microcystin-dependent protein